jgi:hypothetical protein
VIQVEITATAKTYFGCRRLTESPVAGAREGQRQAGAPGRQPKLPSQLRVELPAAEAAA